jgi:uncharacterized protein YbjT (DUF2867 family)
MKIAVIGATGTVGREIVKQAVEQGHDVTALSRSGKLAGTDASNVRVMTGDVFDPDTLLPIVENQDAVIVALGGGLWGNIRSQGTANVIGAMQQTGARRLIVLSSLGVGDSEYVLDFKWRRIMFGLILRAVYLDHFRQERAVRLSDLDWTIVRPGSYDDTADQGKAHIGDLRALRGALKLKISRSDVAQFMLRLAKSADFLRQAPAISH